MENQDNTVYEVFVTDGDKKKSIYLDSYKVTIAISAVLVLFFIFGIIWLASSSAEKNLIKNNKKETSSGSLFHSGGLSDNFKNSVAGASTQKKQSAPIFIKSPSSLDKPEPVKPSPVPQPTDAPKTENNENHDEENNDNEDPTPTNTPAPTETPTPTPTVTPEITPEANTD